MRSSREYAIIPVVRVFPQFRRSAAGSPLDIAELCIKRLLPRYSSPGQAGGGGEDASRWGYCRRCSFQIQSSVASYFSR